MNRHEVEEIVEQKVKKVFKSIIHDIMLEAESRAEREYEKICDLIDKKAFEVKKPKGFSKGGVVGGKGKTDIDPNRGEYILRYKELLQQMDSNIIREYLNDSQEESE